MRGFSLAHCQPNSVSQLFRGVAESAFDTHRCFCSVHMHMRASLHCAHTGLHTVSASVGFDLWTSDHGWLTGGRCTSVVVRGMADKPARCVRYP